MLPSPQVRRVLFRHSARLRPQGFIRGIRFQLLREDIFRLHGYLASASTPSPSERARILSARSARCTRIFLFFSCFFFSFSLLLSLYSFFLSFFLSGASREREAIQTFYRVVKTLICNDNSHARTRTVKYFVSRNYGPTAISATFRSRGRGGYIFNYKTWIR